MQFTGLLKFATGLMILGLSVPINEQSTLAEGQRFFCGNLGGVPATFVKTPEGNKPLILWVSDNMSGLSKTERCQIVSQRFQTFNNNGKLKYIRTGLIKGSPVICVASRKGGNCSSNDVLLTFEPGTDVSLKLKELVNTRRGTKGVFTVASGTISNDRNGVMYADVDQWIKEIEPAEPTK